MAKFNPCKSSNADIKETLPLPEIPRTALLFELREQQYRRYLKNKEISTMDVLSIAINEAYTIGYAAGCEAAKEIVDENVSPQQIELKLQ